jgi:5-formyltetrahydrofolate cyclo-ligase
MPDAVSERPDIVEEKRALRARIKAWRAGLDAGTIARAADAVAAQGLDVLQVEGGAIVSGFASLPDEFRIWPLLRRLSRDGRRLALPVMQGKAKPLVFRAWAPGDALDRGVWGIGEPKADKPELEPDILLVPLLAFDRRGWRLGYGGGFYDRTLAALRARRPIAAVGLAYDEQQVDAVPHLDYDQRLDWMLTPSGPIRCVD